MDYALILPPLLAGLLVLATHVPLGMQVLARGIIFIDLAVAQLAGLGVIVVHVIDDKPSAYTVQIAALVMALLGSLLFRWLETRWASRLEAFIGATFVLSATAALLLLAGNPHGGEQLNDLLAGQLLWVSYEDLPVPAIVTACILVSWRYLNPRNNSLLFYALFALAVTTSVQLVGVYLVFSSLILPALGTYQYPNLKASYAIGGIGYVTGLIVSLATDLPTGPVIVWSLAITAILGGLMLHYRQKNS
ncbi:MAG: metal ABC transporter permease [Gammaproteobacteria bacterium]|nr:metal ABC transporter permease [Gammaproteobacteria bacterium]